MKGNAVLLIFLIVGLTIYLSAPWKSAQSAATQTADPTAAALPPINPRVKQIVDAVSQERIVETLKRLESFYTRHTLSEAIHPARGIGAARQWIYDQFKSYSPRLQVRFDTYFVRKQPPRLFRDFELRNVVAILPGTGDPGRHFIVSAHYDSVARPAGAQRFDWTATEIFAPGVTDDGSGTAAVMELARVMSQFQFEKTIVFIAFAGEEQGLVGSTLYAERAARDRHQIDGVLNNDLIGSEVAGNGFIDNRRVLVFSEEPNDSSSRQLARYIKRAAERYLPGFRVELIFRQERFGRGGDHEAFNAAGFAAVRFNTPNENFAHQHSATDTFENASPRYITQVTRANAAALASLAWAPRAPVVRSERGGLLLGRGRSGYAAALRWTHENPEADLAGFVIVVRSTTSPDWEREIFVGKVNESVLEDTSIDTLTFGVRAIDREGNESLVSTYVNPQRPRAKFETFEPQSN